MPIYDSKTFLVKNFIEAKRIKKDFLSYEINLIHRYDAIVWQGPLYAQLMFNKIRSKKINYIVEVKDNIGLILSLINLGIKMLAVSKKINKILLNKVFSIAEKKKIKILFIEDFRIICKK